ncbi:hypothetical protein DesfrDRAFT_1263 [Solidesulfovibrio fructosivorans JJ]]|uniref:Uncharacterized protein n=1 Tax=Solidesulfovibrio fructosivorans JJ] TaxID=596151 RepID=E1JUG4_SOLFR|nr:hypothetical protein DesfrDRAFT_1263 [Solidesulfovibrio fructosivorans JJ]]
MSLRRPGRLRLPWTPPPGDLMSPGPPFTGLGWWVVDALGRGGVPYVCCRNRPGGTRRFAPRRRTRLRQQPRQRRSAAFQEKYGKVILKLSPRRGDRRGGGGICLGRACREAAAASRQMPPSSSSSPASRQPMPSPPSQSREGGPRGPVAPRRGAGAEPLPDLPACLPSRRATIPPPVGGRRAARAGARCGGIRGRRVFGRVCGLLRSRGCSPGLFRRTPWRPRYCP